MNTVTLTASWGSSASGNYLVYPTGTLVASGGVAVDIPAADGTLDDTGSFSVDLVASDDYTAGVLNWSFKIIVAGMTNIIADDIPILYSNGADQGLFEALDYAGWNETVD
jgi:hypothetical protein